MASWYRQVSKGVWGKKTNHCNFPHWSRSTSRWRTGCSHRHFRSRHCRCKCRPWSHNRSHWCSEHAGPVGPGCRGTPGSDRQRGRHVGESRHGMRGRGRGRGHGRDCLRRCWHSRWKAQRCRAPCGRRRHSSRNPFLRQDCLSAWSLVFWA